MSAELDRFSQQIEERVKAARREPNWQPAEIAQFMGQLDPRRRLFETVGPRLIQTTISPRVQAVAALFPNASLEGQKRKECCGCWFGYCDRFPASAKLEIAVEHDLEITNLIVHYELSIMPVFMKYDADDRLPRPLNNVDEAAVAAWVETKLLGFVDTYLQLDRGPMEIDDEVVFDPVCGMRMTRAQARATADYNGHAYYFCVEDCQRRFVAEPLRYVRFELE